MTLQEIVKTAEATPDSALELAAACESAGFVRMAAAFERTAENMRRRTETKPNRGRTHFLVLLGSLRSIEGDATRWLAATDNAVHSVG